MESRFDNNSKMIKILLLYIALFISIFLVWIFPFHYIYYQIDFKNILLTIIGSSATILAIIFALSQFILQNVSEKYSPKIIDEYENNNESNDLFFLYLIIIALSLLFLIINGLISDIILLYLVLFSFIIYLFIISLIFLINYIKLMFVYTNPFKYSDQKKSELIMDIKNDKMDKVEEGFSIIGDISIKALVGDSIITDYNLENLDEVISEFIGVHDDE